MRSKNQFYGELSSRQCGPSQTWDRLTGKTTGQTRAKILVATVLALLVLTVMPITSTPADASVFGMYSNLKDSHASFWGENAGDRSGHSVASAGDVNGDGYDDILIGARWDDYGGNNAGQTYLIFGKSSGWAMDADLSNADASFYGQSDSDNTGFSVAGAGDVNGDGYDDILIGAPFASLGIGLTYLFFGKPSGWSTLTPLSNADVTFFGENMGDDSGYSVAAAGDVNGDGFDDILIGAPWRNSAAGSTYLIFGKSSGWTSPFGLVNADASFVGENAGDKSGLSVAGGGDVNGDGYDDILIGAPGDDDGGTDAGLTYLVFGKDTGWASGTVLSSADVSFRGEAVGDESGYSVAGAGDVNGDGYEDILIGARWNGESAFQAGQTYLILGKRTGWTKPTILSIVDGSFQGELAGDQSGWSIASAGDVNRDGYDDILIGAPWRNYAASTNGMSYLILGKALGWAMDTPLFNSYASFRGEDDNDYAGYSVSTAGDVNGDGYDDILIGAYGDEDGGGADAGQTYLLFIESAPSPPTDLNIALSPDGGYLNLTWGPGGFWKNLSGYVVYRSMDGFIYHKLAVVNHTTLSYNDTDVIPGRTYWYLVKSSAHTPEYRESAMAGPLMVLNDYDTDLDGIGNLVDLDDDGDGVSDGADAFPLDASEWLDTDRDGVGNNADPDDDNDGYPDISDPYPLDPLNRLGPTIDYINNTVNSIQNTVANIQSNLDGMNTSLMSRVSSAETNILNAIAGLDASLSFQIQNLLVNITNEVSSVNTSLSNQLTSLLDNMTTDNDALRIWLETVLGAIDANLTATNNTLQAQLNALDASMTSFYNSLQSDLSNILVALQSHDSMTGENHSDIKDMLNTLLTGGIGAVDIETVKTMLINLATNLSSQNQSFSNDILGVASSITAFQTDTSQKLDEINATVQDLSKLDDILADLAALDQSLQQAEDELEGTIEEKSDEEVSKIDANTILLVLVLILVIVSIVLNLVTRRKVSKEPTDAETEEEEETQEEDVEFEEE